MNRNPERISPGERGSLFSRGDSQVILIYYSRKKRVTIVASRFSRFPVRSILQYPRKLRYEFLTVTRNVNIRYGSWCGYLRGRFLNISSQSSVTDILCGMGHTVTFLRTRETSWFASSTTDIYPALQQTAKFEQMFVDFSRNFAKRTGLLLFKNDVTRSRAISPPLVAPACRRAIRRGIGLVQWTIKISRSS